MKRLDHSMIFLFIAGTYTPVAVLAMDPADGPVGARRGVGWRARGRRAQDGVAARAAWLAVPIYIALGWVAVFVLPELLHERRRRRVRAAARRRRALHRGRRVLRDEVAEPVAAAPSATTSSSTRRRCWPRICHHVAIWLVLSCASGAGARRRRALGPQVVHLGHRLPQLGQPLVGVLADEPDRPGQRVRSGAGHAGVDQRVEHDPLRLAQARHHRHRGHGEQLLGVADPRPPRDLAAVAVLGLAGDLDALVAGGLPEPGDPARLGGGPLGTARRRPRRTRPRRAAACRRSRSPRGPP